MSISEGLPPLRPGRCAAHKDMPPPRLAWGEMGTAHSALPAFFRPSTWCPNGTKTAWGLSCSPLRRAGTTPVLGLGVRTHAPTLGSAAGEQDKKQLPFLQGRPRSSSFSISLSLSLRSLICSSIQPKAGRQRKLNPHSLANQSCTLEEPEAFWHHLESPNHGQFLAKLGSFNSVLITFLVSNTLWWSAAIKHEIFLV